MSCWYNWLFENIYVYIMLKIYVNKILLDKGLIVGICE